jgi:hypothetical protein
LEYLFAEIYVVLTILSKFSFCLKVNDGQSIGRMYGSPFWGKTKILCKPGEGIANFHAS